MTMKTLVIGGLSLFAVACVGDGGAKPEPQPESEPTYLSETELYKQGPKAYFNFASGLSAFDNAIGSLMHDFTLADDALYSGLEKTLSYAVPQDQKQASWPRSKLLPLAAPEAFDCDQGSAQMAVEHNFRNNQRHVEIAVTAQACQVETSYGGIDEAAPVDITMAAPVSGDAYIDAGEQLLLKGSGFTNNSEEVALTLVYLADADGFLDQDMVWLVYDWEDDPQLIDLKNTQAIIELDGDWLPGYYGIMIEKMTDVGIARDGAFFWLGVTDGVVPSYSLEEFFYEFGFPVYSEVSKLYLNGTLNINATFAADEDFVEFLQAEANIELKTEEIYEDFEVVFGYSQQTKFKNFMVQAQGEMPNASFAVTGAYFASISLDEIIIETSATFNNFSLSVSGSSEPESLSLSGNIQYELAGDDQACMAGEVTYVTLEPLKWQGLWTERYYDEDLGDAYCFEEGIFAINNNLELHFVGGSKILVVSGPNTVDFDCGSLSEDFYDEMLACFEEVYDF